VGRPSLLAGGGEVVGDGEDVDSGVAAEEVIGLGVTAGVDSSGGLSAGGEGEEGVGLGVPAGVDSSGDLSAGGEGEEGVGSGVAVGESEGLGGGAGGEAASVPIGVFFSQLARRRPTKATKMNGCVFISKISTHGSARYSSGTIAGSLSLSPNGKP
jgi:hypothetical protein